MNVEQKVFVVDNLEPEVVAMLQAFYSRSDKSIADRLENLGETSDKIKEGLKKFYIGYGHASIGDCGSTTLFLENVSILAAKALQDDQLYSGQETSTRYFDFENRPYISPLHDEFPELTKIQKACIAMYAKMRPLVLEQIRDEHPLELHTRDDSEADRKKWENATNARAFDIVRCLLPAGMTTQLSWKGSLRRISERLHTLSTHPCPEIAALAYNVNSNLLDRYPNSFKPIEPKEAVPYPFYDLISPATDLGLEVGEVFTDFHSFREFDDANYGMAFLQQRDRKTVVPNFYSMYGQFQFEFLLDYGSFRDIQRHRNSLTPLPMLGAYTINGESNMFHPWYLEQLGAYREEVSAFLDDIYDQLDETILDISSEQNRDMYRIHAQLQYYYPMGTLVPVTVHYGLAEAIYVSELRTSATVHPTLRQIAHGMAKAVRDHFPTIALYTDDSPDGFVLRRGAQTIFERETA